MPLRPTENEQLRAEIASLRERLAEQLRIASYQSERFAFLAQSLPEQMWTARPTGELDFVNQRVTEFFGRTAEEVIGEGWKDYLHPEDLDLCVQRWVHSLTTGEPYQVEFRLRRADGVYRWHLGRAHPQRGPGGAIIRWFGTNTDVTDYKAALSQQQRP